MSDAPQDSPESTSTSKQECCGGSGGHRTLYCILGILGLLVAAFCFEMYVARPAAQNAFDKVASARLKSITNETTLTNLDVRELVGKEPAETFQDGDDQFEVFHWVGGMIVNQHKLFTVYQKDGEDWVFVRHSRHSDDAIENTATIVDAPDDEEEDPTYGADDEEGGGQPGGSGSDSRAGGSGARDSDAARPEVEDDEKTEEKTKPETDEDSEDESQN